MTGHERIVRILDDLRLPRSQYMVNGSGAMVLQGISETERGRPVGDLDIFCATALWFDLWAYRHQTQDVRWQLVTPNPDDPRRRCDPPILRTFMYGLEVDVFSGWRYRAWGNFDVNGLIANAALIDGRWPCARLEFILAWKREVRRDKDVGDIAVLERAIARAT
jgi:hypothetical protein